MSGDLDSMLRLLRTLNRVALGCALLSLAAWAYVLAAHYFGWR